MIDIEAIYISGTFIFLLAAIIYLIVYFVKVYKREKKIEKLLEKHDKDSTLLRRSTVKDIKKNKRDISLSLFMSRWDRFVWIFFSLFTITFLLILLYASLWLGQGLSLKPNAIVVNWGRWLILSIASIIVVACYMYFVSKIRYTPQAFFSVFFGFLSILFILFATLSQTRNTSVLWMIASLISAFFTTLLFLFPKNTLLKRHYHHHHNPSNKSKLPHKRFSYKRTVFVSAIIIAYWLNFIVWVLAKSNEITTVLDFDVENLLYLIIDIVMIYIILMYLIGIMYRRTYHHKNIIYAPVKTMGVEP